MCLEGFDIKKVGARSSSKLRNKSFTMRQNLREADIFSVLELPTIRMTPPTILTKGNDSISFLPLQPHFQMKEKVKNAVHALIANREPTKILLHYMC